jgi:Tfp pilus assembly protein PilV
MEVAVASALLITAMVPILQALTKAHSFSVKVERKTQGLVLAQNKLDEIKARSIYHYADNFTANDTALGGSYFCDVTDDADPTLRTISVSVGYDENGDGALSPGEVDVTLTSYVAKRW